MQVRAIHGADELERYVSFAFEVYRQNPYWVAPDRANLAALIGGRAAGGAHSEVQAFWVEADGEILATLTAVVDRMYNQHWQELTGHLLFFEALPAQDAHVQALFGTACEWLRQKGSRAARSSYLPGWQLPFTIDAYDAVPTIFHAYNPAYYHSYLKNAGFETRRGLAEYQVQFTLELAEQYRQMVNRVSLVGAKLRSWDFSRLDKEAVLLCSLVNDTFASHWGWPQFEPPEMEKLVAGLREFLVPEFTVFAEVGGETVGFVFGLPDLGQALRPGSQKPLGQIDHGVLLMIGVRQGQRGRGINLAMAARCYLAMIERGYRSASYTVVLDDNWPSRRTAEKLGAKVARNFVIYEKKLD